MCVRACTDRMCDCGHGWSLSSSFSVCVCVCNFGTRKTQIIAHEIVFIQSSCSVTIPLLQRSAARWRNTTEQISTEDNQLHFFFKPRITSSRGSLSTQTQNVNSCCVFASKLALSTIVGAENAAFIFENIRHARFVWPAEQKVDFSTASVLPVLKMAKPRRALFIYQCMCCQRSTIENYCCPTVVHKI